MVSTRHFRLLVFDRDGTLMDSAATIAAFMVESFRDLSLEAPPEEDIRSTNGLGLDDTWIACARAPRKASASD